MSEHTLFEDLVVLEQNSFPKKCETCGKIYQSPEDFTAQTEHINGRSGLKSTEDDDGETILELFRNCSCGSTLLDFFADRRDMSARGEHRRKSFNTVLSHLLELGIEREVARIELIYYMKHKKSDLLEKFGVFKKRIKREEQKQTK